MSPPKHIALLGSLMFSLPAVGQPVNERVFTGAVGDSYYDPANWQPYELPTLTGDRVNAQRDEHSELLDFAFRGICMPPGFEVVQLARDPSVFDYRPKINNKGQIVFTRRFDPSDDLTEEVMLADLTILLVDFGCAAPGPCVGDLDNDCDTDLADLSILLASFGQAYP